jgi:hypothetical protein
MSYRLAHVDGRLVVDQGSIQIGVLPVEAGGDPLITFQVKAGTQLIPVHAHGRLAVVVFCYAATVERLQIMPPQVNVSARIVTVPETEHVKLVADHIAWHTSSVAREAAERMVNEMYPGNGNIGSWPGGSSC